MVDEDVQMHADSLYQRMLQHESEVEKAKENGTPIPIFEPALPKINIKNAVAPTEELQKQWKEQIDKLPQDERAAEEAALRADLQAKSDVARNVKQIWDAKKQEREARQADGQGDTHRQPCVVVWEGQMTGCLTVTCRAASGCDMPP